MTPALTLTQPWASLVALGLKRIETRDWQTTLRGRLAIHAASAFPLAARDFAASRRVQEVLPVGRNAGPRERALSVWPTGVVLCTVELKAILPTDDTDLESLLDEEGAPNEYEFGNYEPGRFAWLLADPRPVDPPRPAAGRLRIWTWND